MNDLHHYEVLLTWTGNTGTGTTGYKDYSRDFTLEAQGKPALQGSSDATFRGSRERWNPEEMLVAALSSCHKLSYLHLCAVNGVVVKEYRDRAEGVMRFDPQTGSGRFERVTLHPEVQITAQSDPAKADALHHKAHELCFIANSVNFPVLCEANTAREGETRIKPEMTAVGH